MPMPKTEVDFKVLDALLQFKVTKEFCADYLKISEDAIDRRIREEFQMTFGKYHNMRMGRTAVKIQQKIVEMALAGNPKLLELAAKYIAGWTEKIDINLAAKDTIEIELAYSKKKVGED